MSDLGPVDSNCVVRVIGRHCPGRDQCVLLYRAPGPRLLFGSELMSELDDERGIYLETHAKQLEADLISITVDHVGADGHAGGWRYRLLPMQWKTEDGLVEHRRPASRSGRTRGPSHDARLWSDIVVTRSTDCRPSTAISPHWLCSRRLSP